MADGRRQKWSSRSENGSDLVQDTVGIFKDELNEALGGDGDGVRQVQDLQVGARDADAVEELVRNASESRNVAC